MGYDISNHAVDVELIQQRLIPALGGRGSIDDILARAAGLSAISARANQWGLRVTRLSHAISDKQRELGFERTIAVPKKNAGWLDRVLGRSRTEEIRVPELTTGLPGFDPDLCVWGRPFFIVADSTDEALAELDRYMKCPPNDLARVDAIAGQMIAKLESKRREIGPDVRSEIVAVLDSFQPIAEHVPDLEEGDGGNVDIDATRRRLADHFAAIQKTWAARDTDQMIARGEDGDEPVPAAELAVTVPYALLNLAAHVLPGWMGRGYVWPTALFEKIGVDVSAIFETPTALFEPLVRDFPNVETGFHTTIPENYSLGGYVRPENIAALKALLLKHERELILAWTEPGTATALSLEELSADFRKILEPVTLAERHGYGFIEAAEVYSGILGVMN